MNKTKNFQNFQWLLWFISTSLLNILRYLHIKPINLVVSQEPNNEF